MVVVRQMKAVIVVAGEKSYERRGSFMKKKLVKVRKSAGYKIRLYVSNEGCNCRCW